MKLGMLVGVLIGLVGIGGCISGEGGWFSLIFIGLGIGAYFGIFAIGGLPKGVKSEETAGESPAAKRRQSEGWHVGEKPSNVQ